MAVFWRLILAHFIADFTFQTNKVASWKRESRTGMLVHILTHPVVAYAFTWPYLSLTWVDTRWIQLNGWVCVALIYFGPNWVLWSLLLRVLGRRHPPTLDDREALGQGRAWIGALGLVVFIACFVPNPIVWSWRDFFETIGLTSH